MEGRSRRYHDICTAQGEKGWIALVDCKNSRWNALAGVGERLFSLGNQMGAEESNATRGFTDLRTNLQCSMGPPHPIGSTPKCRSQLKRFLGDQFK